MYVLSNSSQLKVRRLLRDNYTMSPILGIKENAFTASHISILDYKVLKFIHKLSNRLILRNIPLLRELVISN